MNLKEILRIGNLIFTPGSYIREIKEEKDSVGFIAYSSTLIIEGVRIGAYAAFGYGILSPHLNSII